MRQKQHVQSSKNFLHMLPVAVDQSYSDDSAIMLCTSGFVDDVIMAALHSRCGHYIFVLWFISIFYLLSIFIPRLISAAADWMSTIFPHVVWP